MSGSIRNQVGLSNSVVGNDLSVKLLNGRSARYVHFDNSASTPALKSVALAVEKFLPYYANIYRGQGWKSAISEILFEESRKTISRFLQFDLQKYHLIFTHNATSSLQFLANHLTISKNDIILVSKMEHQANDFPWRAKSTVVYIEIDAYGRLDLKDLESKLKANSGNVALVAVTAASNVTGYINDVNSIAEIAHHYGAKIVVDAAQYIPHRPMTIQSEDELRSIDYLVFTAQKMYAPYGTGVLVARKDQGFVPDIHGGKNSRNDEPGTPNLLGIFALAMAMKEINTIGFDFIKQHETELLSELFLKLKDVPDIITYGATKMDSGEDRLGVVSFNLNGIPHGLVGAILSNEAGIGVRTGSFCNSRYMNCLQSLKISSTVENQPHAQQPIPGAIRTSFAFYNSVTEIDRLITMLKQIQKSEYLGQYDVDPKSGKFEPKNFQRDDSQLLNQIMGE